MTVGVWVKVISGLGGGGATNGTEVCGIQIGGSSVELQHTVTTPSDEWEYLELTADAAGSYFVLYADKPSSGEFQVVFSGARYYQGKSSRIWSPSSDDRGIWCPEMFDEGTIIPVRGVTMLPFHMTHSQASGSKLLQFEEDMDVLLGGGGPWGGSGAWPTSYLPGFAYVYDGNLGNLRNQKMMSISLDVISATHTITVTFRREDDSNWTADTYKCSGVAFFAGMHKGKSGFGAG